MAFTLSSGQIGVGAVLTGTHGAPDSGTVQFGGTAISTAVKTGGILTVLRGGLVSDTTVFAGGTELVMPGALAEGGVVSVGGSQTIGANALVNDETIVGGGATVGGDFLNGILDRHAHLQVVSGGTVDNAGLFGSSRVEVTSGGLLNNTVLSDHARVAVLSGGTASATFLEGANLLVVHSGGTATDIFVSGGGGVASGRVDPGASAADVQVDSGAIFGIGAGAVVSMAFVSNGGIIQDYGRLIQANVVSNGHLLIHNGGVTTGTDVGLLGTETVRSGGIASGTVLSFFGQQQVLIGGTASDTVVSNGGQLLVERHGTLEASTIVGGGLVSLFAGAVDNASVTFVSSGGVIAWGGQGRLAPHLAGFGLGDTIDLTALPFASGGTVTQHGLVVSVTENGTTDAIAFASGTVFSGAGFALADDGIGGTAVTLVSSGGAVTLLPAHFGSG